VVSLAERYYPEFVLAKRSRSQGQKYEYFLLMQTRPLPSFVDDVDESDPWFNLAIKVLVLLVVILLVLITTREKKGGQ